MVRQRPPLTSDQKRDAQAPAVYRRQRLHQAHQVLARLNRARVQQEEVGQCITGTRRCQRGPVVEWMKLRRRGFVDHVDRSSRHP